MKSTGDSMSKGDTTTSAGSPFDDEPTRDTATSKSSSQVIRNPPISIFHLLVWTALSAAAMRVTSWLDRSRARPSFEFEDFYLILLSIYSGLVVGGVLIWLARRWRRMPFPVEPGEWLWLFEGIGILLVA